MREFEKLVAMLDNARIPYERDDSNGVFSMSGGIFHSGMKKRTERRDLPIRFI